MKTSTITISTGASLLLLVNILQGGEGTACQDAFDCNSLHECKLNKGSGKKECHKHKFFVCKKKDTACTEVCKEKKLKATDYIYTNQEKDDDGKTCDKKTACLCKE